MTASVAALALAALPLGAQDGGRIGPDDIMGGPTDPRERAIELFHEIETRLFKISDDLAAAGAGGGLDDVADGGIQKLLDDVNESGASVTSGIDELLALAQQMGGQSMQGGMSQGQQKQQSGQGQSPLDRPQGSRTQEEQTPEGPRPDGEQGSEQSPGEQGSESEKPQGEPTPKGERPGDEGASPLDGENRPGEEDPPEAGDPNAPQSGADSWGHLPPRTQQVFRNQGGEDLPIQYRDWIDAYYRRLNESE
ncbi:MAG: hypothetical protein WD226_13750 [Planctomycetota bacterium]